VFHKQFDHPNAPHVLARSANGRTKTMTCSPMARWLGAYPEGFVL
jgi:hypothetical protein